MMDTRSSPTERDSAQCGRRIAVVGGGISGLAAAHRLVELDPNINLTLFDPSDHLGGVLGTVHQQGFQVEQSADNFITTVPWGIDLCKRLGLESQLVPTNPTYRQTFVVRRGRLRKLPDGFLMMAPSRMWPLAVTPILSPAGKFRAALEYFIRPREGDDDESMAAFVRRRLGREVFERLVEPLVGAVYAADMEKLSLLATLPRFRRMEQEHGSLIRAMRRQMAARRKVTARQEGAESGARYSMFLTLRHGLSSLVDALAARLPKRSVRLETSIEQIEPSQERWTLTSRGGTPESGTSETFDAVILATPAHVAARLLGTVEPALARDLGQIEYEGTAILSVAYRREQIAHRLDGMGFVVPRIENSPILAGSFSSQKYVHRAPADQPLLRVFAGGAHRPEMAKLDAAPLCKRLLGELDRLLGIRGEPLYQAVFHWPGTMPQYHVGHVERVDRIEASVAALKNLELAGNAYHGVGLPNCIHSGEQAAERLIHP